MSAEFEHDEECVALKDNFFQKAQNEVLTAAQIFSLSSYLSMYGQQVERLLLPFLQKAKSFL